MLRRRNRVFPALAGVWRVSGVVVPMFVKEVHHSLVKRSPPPPGFEVPFRVGKR